jgi:hypothetical protein
MLRQLDERSEQVQFLSPAPHLPNPQEDTWMLKRRIVMLPNLTVLAEQIRQLNKILKKFMREIVHLLRNITQLWLPTTHS